MALLRSSALDDCLATVKGMRVCYSAAGDSGEPVILVHGGAGTRRDWSKNLAALAASHRVFAPDLVGFGQSARLTEPHTIHHFADFLSGFMDAFGIQKALLVGHSLGGRTCLELAHRHPERVSKMVLIAPMGFGRLSVPGYVLGTTYWATLKALRRPLPYPSMDIRLRERDLERFRSVAAPTLIAWGRWDIFFSPRHSQRALELLPNSALRLFSRSGHSPHRNEPASFNKTVLDFFAEP
ncbi:MAG: alpha/beta fold hydrolase [Chloroflexi bacterium]|nr:alpha/beta fold hydrolase [Chloroflexota bacterium]